MGLKEAGLRGSLRNVSSVLPASAFFDVTVTNTNSPVTKGDVLSVDYSANNTGDVQDTQDIRLVIDIVEEDRDSNVTLGGGVSTTGTLQWDTTNENATTYTATVLSNDDTDSVTVEVESAIPDSGLLHRWNVSDASYPITDSVGGNDFSQGLGGTFETGSQFFDGVAFSTDGVDDYGIADAYVDNVDEFTVSWFGSVVDPSPQSVQGIFHNGNTNGQDWPRIYAFDGEVRGLINDGSGAAFIGAPLAADTLTHVVLRYDGSTLSLVLDTVEEATTSVSQTQPTSTSEPLLGAVGSATGITNYGEVTADLGLFYGRYLSDAEIQGINDAHPST